MDDKIRVFQDTVLVRWGQMSKSGLEESDSTVINTAKNCNNQVIYFAMVPTSLPIPDATVRVHMSKQLDILRKCCSSISVVVEGRGLKQAALRSIAASFLLVGGRNMHVFGSLEEGLRDLNIAKASEILEFARKENLISV